VPVLGTAVGDGPTLRGVPTDHVLLLDVVAVGQSSAVFDFLCVCHKVMIFG